MKNPGKLRRRKRITSGKALRRSAQVPDQYWGYSLQAIRFLQVLLDAPPGAVVSLEVFEDVGRTDSNGQLASQVKTGLVKNPLADRSVDFWKTFDNWVRAIETSALNPDFAIFEIYVAKPRTGRLAKLFDNAQSEQQAADAVSAARAALLPKGKSGQGLPGDLGKYVEHVLKPSNSCLTKIVQKFRITSARRDPLADLRPAVATKWVRPESIDLVIQHAHGWLKERIDSLLQTRKPVMISSDEFNQEMLRFLPRCDFRLIVANMAGRPTQGQIEAERLRTYVRQMEIIHLEDEGVLEAINSFLRASVMRTKLSEEGIVHEDSFEEYKEALMAFWRNKRRQNSLSHPSHSDVQNGQLLFTDCSLHRQRLQGLELPDYFTPGSYHSLADDIQLGWHPNYERLLEESTS